MFHATRDHSRFYWEGSVGQPNLYLPGPDGTVIIQNGCGILDISAAATGASALNIQVKTRLK